MELGRILKNVVFGPGFKEAPDVKEAPDAPPNSEPEVVTPKDIGDPFADPADVQPKTPEAIAPKDIGDPFAGPADVQPKTSTSAPAPAALDFEPPVLHAYVVCWAKTENDGSITFYDYLSDYRDAILKDNGNDVGSVNNLIQLQRQQNILRLGAFYSDEDGEIYVEPAVPDEVANVLLADNTVLIEQAKKKQQTISSASSAVDLSIAIAMLSAMDTVEEKQAFLNGLSTESAMALLQWLHSPDKELLLTILGKRVSAATP